MENNPNKTLPLRKIKTVEKPNVVPRIILPMIRDFFGIIKTALITWIVPNKTIKLLLSPTEEKNATSSAINRIFAIPEAIAKPITTTSISVFSTFILAY